MNYKILTMTFIMLLLSSIASMVFLTNPSIIINGPYNRAELMTGFIIAMSVFMIGLFGSITSFSFYVTEMEGQQ